MTLAGMCTQKYAFNTYEYTNSLLELSDMPDVIEVFKVKSIVYKIHFK